MLRNEASINNGLIWVFVIFKYLFYRYNMNERDLRAKKQSLVICKNLNDKTFNNSHIKSGPNC